MAINDQRFDPGQILQYARPSGLNRKNPAAFAPSLTISRGQAMGRKISNDLCYPLNTAASDGTQTFVGFSEYALGTDANGLVYLTFGGSTAGASYLAVGSGYASLFSGGIFNPNDVYTAALGTSPVAEVDTITPAPTTASQGDVYTVSLASGVAAEFTCGATTTATAVVTGLAAAWNANPALVALATTSGTSTLILTAVNKGQALNLSVSCVGVGAITKAITTAGVAGTQSEVDTWTLTTAPSTGDTFTLTWTQPNTQTTTAVATVGSTATVAAATVLIAAAWNAVPALAQLATATSTSATVVLTAVIAGNAINAAMSTTSTSTTLSKATTKPALGQNIADIQLSRPGAYVDVNGFWVIP